jgi:peptide methionine sulfoxide reductase MsrB
MRARVLLLLVATASAEQCGGGAVTRELEFGIPPSDWRMANHVCCHNTRGAEPRGYLDSLRLYERLNRTGETTFYDSVCGLPLFVAPRGRSFDEFWRESSEHGWPSFRPAEMIAENVEIYDMRRDRYGPMRSTCGTHLGHNIPDRLGDRFCIDLVCVAGAPALAERGTDATSRSSTIRVPL